MFAEEMELQTKEKLLVKSLESEWMKATAGRHGWVLPRGFCSFTSEKVARLLALGEETMYVRN